MNFDSNFLDQPEFITFKHAIGRADAFESLFRLGARSQVERKLIIHLPLKFVAATLRIAPEELKPEEGLKALLESGFLLPVTGQPDNYHAKLFIDHNAGLIASWDNGKLGGRPKSPRPAPKPPQEEDNGDIPF